MAAVRNRHVFNFTLTISITTLPVFLALCPSGHYLSPKGCLKCPKRSYMDADNHTNDACKECEDADDTKVLTSECNATHNSELKCKERSFSKNGRPLVCQICRECNGTTKYEAAICTNTSDAVCCPEPAMNLEPINGNMTCLHISSDTKLCCIRKATTTSIASSSKFQSEDSPIDQITGSNGTMDSSSADKAENSSSMEPGTIIGIVLGIFVGILGVGIVVYRFRHQIQSLCSAPPPPPPPNEVSLLS